MRLIRSLYEKAYTRQDILSLFRFLDWLMALPEDLARSFKSEVRRIEEEKKKMPFVTSVELLGREEGLQQGLQEGYRPRSSIWWHLGSATSRNRWRRSCGPSTTRSGFVRSTAEPAPSSPCRLWRERPSPSSARAGCGRA